MAERQRAVGQQIRQAREDKRWKQKQLAAAVHVEPQTVSNWERGVSTPDLEMLERIANVFDRPLNFFLPEPAGRPRQVTTEDLAELRRDLDRQAETLAEILEALRRLLGQDGDGPPSRPDAPA